MEDLYPAKLDGYPLEIETLDDTFEKAIARHEFPKQDGALLEDMGQKARTVSIRCYFWDHGDHQTYADHIDFLNHLKSTALSELIHPQYGVMAGMVERVSVRHDDREMTAEIDLSFIENLRGTIADINYEDVEAVAEEAFLFGEEEQQASLAAELGLVLAEDKGFLDVALDEGKSLYEQLNVAARYSREVIKEIDTSVAAFNATVVELTNPVNSLVASVAYGTSLPGRVIGSITRAVERTALLVTGTLAAPARIISNLDFELRKLEQAFLSFSPAHSRASGSVRAILGRQLKVAAARRLALETATFYRADETARQDLRRIEAGKSFDILGRYQGTAPTVMVMNVTELEQSLALVRTYLQQGVDAARDVPSIKDMARSLLEHINTIKLERDKIITVALDNPMPLHIVCHRYGLDYNYAERISSINAIKNPNFTSGEVQIYGRPGGQV
jgi:prophage DNA circulation protein